MLGFIEKHDRSGDGIDVVAFSDEEPQCCVVNFSSMNPGKFERISWFERRRLAVPALYLFFKDELQHYYRGTPGSRLLQRRQDLMAGLMSEYGISPGRTIAVGSSMGGYAAVAFASEMSFGACVTINPQVDRASAGLHSLSLWSRKMDEAEWEDLDRLVRRTAPRSTEFLAIHGAYEADVAAVTRLVSAFEAVGATYSREALPDREHGWAGMPSERLFRLLDVFAANGRLL